MTQVKIKGQVITAEYGALKDGDILTCGEEFARHLVVDANAAEYLPAVIPEPAPAPERDKSRAKKTSGK